MANREIEIVLKAKDLASSKVDKINAKIKQTSDQTKRTEKTIAASSKKIRSSLSGIQKGFVAVTAAVLATKGAFDLANKAAKFEQAKAAFDNIAKSYGANADAMIANLRRVSGQTLSTAQIIESAGNAMVLGIPAERLEKMMEIARASSRITGQTVQKSFEDIALGVGRGSKMILDNLGIMLDVDKANQAYAKSIGKTVAQLTDAEKKTAFLNATMDAGDVIINRIGKGTETSAEKFQSFSAKIDDLSVLMGKAFLRIGGVVGGMFLPIMDKAITGLEDFFAGLDAQDDKWDKLDQKINHASESLEFLTRKFGENSKQAIKAQENLDRALLRKQEFLDTEIAKQIELNKVKKAGIIVEPELPEAEVQATLEDPRVKFGQESEIVLITQRAMANEQKLEQLRFFHNQEIELARQHGASLSELEMIQEQQNRDEAQHTAQFRMKTAANVAGALSNIAQNLNTALGGKSKKAFKVMQAAAIAQTAIDTSRAAMGAYSSLAGIPIIGPILGVAAAGAAIAAGAAQIQQIKSQSFGGGGSVSMSGGANPSRTGGGASAQGVPVRLEDQQQEQQGGNVTIQIMNPLNGDIGVEAGKSIVDIINKIGAGNNIKIEQGALEI